MADLVKTLTSEQTASGHFGKCFLPRGETVLSTAHPINPSKTERTGDDVCSGLIEACVDIGRAALCVPSW